jgi:hypothetical protein
MCCVAAAAVASASLQSGWIGMLLPLWTLVAMLYGGRGVWSLGNLQLQGGGMRAACMVVCCTVNGC